MLPARPAPMVPVSARLLELAYLRSGWLYLEHRVLALSSHAFLRRPGSGR